MNIGKISALVDMAGGLGLPENRAKEVLETREYKASVDQDWTRSQKMRIKVAPTMVFNEKYFSYGLFHNYKEND